MVDSGPMGAVARVFNVVGFAGSLRRGSYNRALLRAATELAPPALHIVIHELDGIPLYNGDIEDAGPPQSVAQLRDAIRKADGVLIATPEYNHGVPGVLKNTIDWLSRPWAHVNFVNLFNDDPDDTGVAGVDIFKMDADGGAIEHWDVLQTVGDRRNSVPWFAPNVPRANPNGMF